MFSKCTLCNSNRVSPGPIESWFSVYMQITQQCISIYSRPNITQRSIWNLWMCQARRCWPVYAAPQDVSAAPHMHTAPWDAAVIGHSYQPSSAEKMHFIACTAVMAIWQETGWAHPEDPLWAVLPMLQSATGEWCVHFLFWNAPWLNCDLVHSLYHLAIST